MPNGNEKVWVRTAHTIASFKRRYGRWPTRLVVPNASESSLRSAYMGEENVAQIRQKLEIVEDSVLWDYDCVAVEDDRGNRVIYPDGGGDMDEVNEWIKLVRWG